MPCTRRRTPGLVSRSRCLRHDQGLVADDHAVVRRGLATLLATAPDLQLVGTASDGAEAVRLAIDSGADVVVMDLSMPEVDGVAATRELASQMPSCRVLVLTSFSDQGRVTDALRAGADGYLLKHAEPEDILDGIREVVRGGSPLDPAVARILLNTSRTRVAPVDCSPRVNARSSSWSRPGSTIVRSVAGSTSPNGRSSPTCITSSSGWV